MGPPSRAAPGGSGGPQDLGSYPLQVQESLVLDDLLFAMMGVPGRYVQLAGRAPEPPLLAASVKAGTLAVPARFPSFRFVVDSQLDPSLAELAGNVLPLCDAAANLHWYCETRSRFEHGLTCQALAAALRTLLRDWRALAAQLEHQMRLGRLTLQVAWYYCQPAAGPLLMLGRVVEVASTSNAVRGAPLLNLLLETARGAHPSRTTWPIRPMGGRETAFHAGEELTSHS